MGSNPTPSARLNDTSLYDKGRCFSSSHKQGSGEMAELAEGARLLSECVVKAAPRVRIPLSPPFLEKPNRSVGLFFIPKDFFRWLVIDITACVKAIDIDFISGFSPACSHAA